MTVTQKQIAQRLDQLAENAYQAGAAPSTGKQNWFLAKLILDNIRIEMREDDYESAYAICEEYVPASGLDKKTASTMISAFLN